MIKIKIDLILQDAINMIKEKTVKILQKYSKLIMNKIEVTL